MKIQFFPRNRKPNCIMSPRHFVEIVRFFSHERLPIFAIFTVIDCWNSVFRDRLPKFALLFSNREPKFAIYHEIICRCSWFYNTIVNKIPAFSEIVCRNSWFYFAIMCQNSWFFRRLFDKICLLFSDCVSQLTIFFWDRLSIFVIFSYDR